jgi:indole-3-glycerol phosphate synthase
MSQAVSSILQQILESTRNEVARRKQQFPLATLQAHELYTRKPFSLKATLQLAHSPQIIAEFKRRSPSKGEINPSATIESVVRGYQNAGAVAVSVLTDGSYFGGSLQDLEAARSLTSLPILRKDFMVDAYQLHEAKAHGADLVLLIAAALDVRTCRELAQEAHALGLEVLLEVHSLEELHSHYSPEVDLLGVNNRSLSSFATSIEVSRSIASQLPKAVPTIAESGLQDANSVQQLWQLGYKGFLIGETFMRSNSPGLSCQQLIGALQAR